MRLRPPAVVEIRGELAPGGAAPLDQCQRGGIDPERSEAIWGRFGVSLAAMPRCGGVETSKRSALQWLCRGRRGRSAPRTHDRGLRAAAVRAEMAVNGPRASSAVPNGDVFGGANRLPPELAPSTSIPKPAQSRRSPPSQQRSLARCQPRGSWRPLLGRSHRPSTRGRHQLRHRVSRAWPGNPHVERTHLPRPRRREGASYRRVSRPRTPRPPILPPAWSASANGSTNKHLGT